MDIESSARKGEIFLGQSCNLLGSALYRFGKSSKRIVPSLFLGDSERLTKSCPESLGVFGSFISQVSRTPCLNHVSESLGIFGSLSLPGKVKC